MFSSEHTNATPWMPDHIDIADFDLPDLDEIDGARSVSRREVEAAVREALAQRDEDEAAVREQLQADAFAAGVAQGRAESEEAVRAALTNALEALWLATEEVR